VVTRGIIIAGALALTACAGSSKQTKSSEEQSQLICTYERAIGSNIPERVCREPEDQPEPAQGGAQTQPGGQSTR
jgi:hypothetical protein